MSVNSAGSCMAPRRTSRLNLFGGCLAAAVMVLGGLADAQADGLHDPYTDISDYLLPGEPPASQISTITQFGSGNTATVTMTGEANASFQFQGGEGNVATIQINGRRNAVGIAQAGSGNDSNVGVGGNGNRIVNLQIGNNLSYSVNVVGDGKTVIVTQVGSK